MEKKITHTLVSIVFQLSVSGFPVSSGISIKKVSDTTVCISSKTWVKHLLVIRCLLLTPDNMKLIVLCLFAVCCCSSAKASTKEREKLQEVLRELKLLRSNLQSRELMKMNTPPKDIEDCCCLTALNCFRNTLRDHFGVNDKYPRKLYRSLNHQLTISGMNFCNTENSTTSCPTCLSHPEEEASEFFSRLESLIQRGLSRID